MVSATCGGLLFHRHYLNFSGARTSINFRPRPRGRRPWCSPIPTKLKDWGIVTRPKDFGALGTISCTKPTSEMESRPIDCVGIGVDVECVIPEEKKKLVSGFHVEKVVESDPDLFSQALEWAVLISPFFFWGTAMVAMKEVLPKAGPFFVAAFRMIPSGLLLVSYASYTKRKLPSGFLAWLSIALFGMVDATCFQGFLAEGLQRTSAGLGSVIIDSQPLTVAILASLLFGETIDGVGAAGLVLGVIGLLLLEIPVLTFNGSSTVWGSGEWWMFLAAQSMAIGTIMVRWVSKYSDPIMATGWHMVIGGLPLLAISVLNHDPAITGSLRDLTLDDISALAYTSIFGSAISYGVYFYNATKVELSVQWLSIVIDIMKFDVLFEPCSLTQLSSLTFLTPMFASIFGYLYLDETFSTTQLVGAAITLIGIYMVNFRRCDQTDE